MPISKLKRLISERLGERGGFVHSVGSLVGGTAFAQGLALLALPLLTRLYTPAEFSVLAAYAAALAILVVIGCLRLEIAIPLPQRDENAANLLALSLCFSLLTAFATAAVVLVFQARLADLLHAQGLAPYLWLLPLGVWMGSSYAALQFWSTRKKRFPRIARTRMQQALSGIGLQVGAGWLGAGPIGLLLGHLMNGGAGVLGLARDAWRYDKSSLQSVSSEGMREALGNYSRFPKYSALEALVNTAGSQLPILLIATLAVGPEAGYLMLAIRIMAAPMALIGASMSQVYLAHAADRLREARLGEFTSWILHGLVKLGVGPLLFAGLVAEPLSGFVFGEEWKRTGELVGWMTPWFVLQFLASPVSMVMHITGRQRAMLALTVAGLCMRFGAVAGAYYAARGHMSELFAVAGAVFYAVCCGLFYRCAGVGKRDIWLSARRAWLPLTGWVLVGVALRTVLGVGL